MSLLKVAGTTATSGQLYVNDVFSVYLYTGNGSTQTINNGIDLAGKGGLVWIKTRSNASNHKLTDTVRGATKGLISNDTAAQTTDANGLTSFGSTGFSIGTDSVYNGALTSYVSWTFRKAAKFFDVVSLTNGTTTYSHSLGVAPGMIVVKCTSAAGANWVVYHRSLTDPTTYYLSLNTTDQQLQLGGATIWGVTASTFTVSSSLWANGTTGIAYLFAHDTAADGIIQCGSFTSDGSGNATVNLGWEPQYLMFKRSDGVGDWFIEDSMRGFTVTTTAYLKANLSDAEIASNNFKPSASGFYETGWLGASQTFIYMAIRRPNKPPTSGTQVYNAIVRTGTGAAATVTGVGFPPDYFIIKDKSTGGQGFTMDRLRGVNKYLLTDGSGAEGSTTTTVSSINMDGVSLITSGFVNGSAKPYINWFFKRAPGFFDEVCYTGTGVATTQAHNLTVAPELVIIKNRTGIGSGAPDGFGNAWWVLTKFTTTEFLASRLQVTNAGFTENYSTSLLLTAAPTSTGITLGNYGGVNATAFNYVAYLFATLAGISNVGSYTGNGTGQAIACGFSAGARFVLIKRTDATGDWYTFDSARGLTSGSSPYLLLNSTAAEVTGNNGVYASTGGFTLGSTAITTTNIATATYIFLAVA